MVYEVVHCNECGKPVKSVPTWLGGVNVRFTCEACRQKHPKPLSYDTAVVAPARASSDDLDEPGEVVAVDEDADEEVPDVEAIADEPIEE